MTIHSSHPFAQEPDQARRFRGRLGGAVSLWTAGAGDRGTAGLTVTSLMLAGGDPSRALALVDPDADLTDVLTATGRAVVTLLSWRHRELADAFAGVAPAPGGPFRMASWVDTAWGPQLADAATWAHVSLESAATVGWSTLLTCRIDAVEVADDAAPLLHRRGRYQRPEPPGADGGAG